MTDESRKRTIGTASVAATDAVEQNPQLHEEAAAGQQSFIRHVMLLTLIVLSTYGCPGAAHAVRGEPAHHVGDFLIRHRPCRRRFRASRERPVGAARDDDRAQPLIARPAPETNRS